MSLSIGIISESDYGEVNDFCNRTRFLNNSSNKRTRSFSEFCWEYCDTPGRKTIFIGVWEMTDHKRMLSGIHCIIIHELINGFNKTCLAAKGEDTLIDTPIMRKYRGRDILSEMIDVAITECKRQGAQFLWGFNNIPATYHRLGFTTIRCHNGILVLDPLKAYKEIMKSRQGMSVSGKTKTFLLCILSWLNYLNKNQLRLKSIHQKVDSNLSENAHLFYQASQEKPFFFTKQDSQYLNWRILQNPYQKNLRSYELCNDNGKIIAQIICSLKDNSSIIEQFIFDIKSDKGSIQSFLSKVFTSLKNENIILVRNVFYNNTFLNNLERDYLKNAGFEITGQGDFFTFKAVSDDLLLTPENFYLSRLYKQGRS